MSVVPLSHFSLSRQRKAMSEALEQQSWQSVADIDRKLAGALGDAVDDPNKDMKVLLGELGHILKVYKELVVSCQEQASELVTGS